MPLGPGRHCRWTAAVWGHTAPPHLPVDLHSWAQALCRPCFHESCWAGGTKATFATLWGVEPKEPRDRDRVRTASLEPLGPGSRELSS